MVKTRHGFVSNSSSTSFVIYNKTDKRLDLEEFVKENPQLVKEYDEEYELDNLTIEEAFHQMILEARERMDYSKKKDRTQRLKPGPNIIQFGDEEGTTLGRVYDYILRDGGESKRFRWWFDSFNR